MMIMIRDHHHYPSTAQSNSANAVMKAVNQSSPRSARFGYIVDLVLRE